MTEEHCLPENTIESSKRPNIVFVLTDDQGYGDLGCTGNPWLLLRNGDKLTADQSVRLGELLAANEALATVYILKDDLKHLWDYKYEAWARRFWEGWKRRALDSGLAPLRRFAERLEPYLPGIFAHCRHPLHTSLLEGINNTIKVIKRTAYGYRDDDYFFLQIKAAFPGKTG
jgi:transposase